MSSPFKPPRASPGEQRALLQSVLERASNAIRRRPALVVFDLDGTLLDNRPRSVAILHELADAWAQRHPREAERLRRADAADLAYLLEESLELLGIRDRELVDEAKSFWRERFFTDRFLSHDRPTEGAVSFTRACHEAGANVVYLTGRDLPNMALGSLASLRDLGFPIGVPATQLVLKPNAADDDTQFKRLVAPQFHRSGEVIASFDNEPGNCNLFTELFPEADSVLVDTQHLPGAPALDQRVRVIEHFGHEP
ncbi:MAG: HAD family hydrolase [Sorangiineae bacterium]|nr:HAD family hydrolase [Polyangiaceae bacterium]MEB2320958.1 HAD family hydrolase [Sorangiineae bacterium]